MHMKALYVADRIDKWNFSEDTTPLLIDECRRRGGKTWFTTARDISLKASKIKVVCQEIEIVKGTRCCSTVGSQGLAASAQVFPAGSQSITDDSQGITDGSQGITDDSQGITDGSQGIAAAAQGQPVGSQRYLLGDSREMELGFFDIVHIRSDPPFDLEYYYSTLLLEMAPRNTLVVNDPRSLRDLNEKLAIFNFPKYVADSLVTYNAEEAADFVGALGGKAVAKELSKCSSRGITLLEGSRSDLLAKLEPLVSCGGGQILVQRFLEGVKEGETRVTLIDGKPLGVMKKVPRKGSFLASMDFGAKAKSYELNERELELSTRVGAFLFERGVVFAALDIIDGWLSEINITSPGLLRHCNDVMGTNLESELEDALERRLSTRKDGKS